MIIDDVINRFNTMPVLFVGSGLTRRYLNLPDWKNLLIYFAEKVSDDVFAYSSYENEAQRVPHPVGIMPKIAELIQADFNKRWYSDPSIRTLTNDQLENIRQGGDPFKYEIASFIKRSGIVQKEYEYEIELLRKIAEKNISGIITTNYDSFLEDTCIGFKKYVGQKQLIFSAIQGIAEIYKIHGSVEVPDSIIINERDYQAFMADSAYLAAKLMTIFMEYPIIFIGYSISDNNILEILNSIVHCLDDAQIQKLEDRFVFVEYTKDADVVEVNPHTIIIDGKPLIMKRIRLNDFSILYKALEKKRSKLPVRLLRRFKEELYDYTITNAPTAKLRVASIDDSRVNDDDLVLAIGKASEFGLKGLSGIDGNEWYRNVILDDIDYSADEMLKYAFPKIIKTNTGRLPVNKYLALAKEEHPDAEAVAKDFPFDKIISNTFKKSRSILGEYCSVKQIWENEKGNLEKATRLIAHLREEQIVISELENVLINLFEEDVNILSNETQAVRTNIRRLIMIYDYMKWGKE